MTDKWVKEKLDPFMVSLEVGFDIRTMDITNRKKQEARKEGQGRRAARVSRGRKSLGVGTYTWGKRFKYYRVEISQFAAKDIVTSLYLEADHP